MNSLKKLMQGTLLCSALFAISTPPANAENTAPPDIKVFAPKDEDRPEAKWSFEQRAEDLTRKNEQCLADTKKLPPANEREANVTNVQYCTVYCREALRNYEIFKQHTPAEKLAEMVTPSIKICEDYYHGLHGYITQNNLKEPEYGVPLINLENKSAQYIVDNFLAECKTMPNLREHTCGCSANRIITCINQSGRTDECARFGPHAMKGSCR